MDYRSSPPPALPLISTKGQCIIIIGVLNWSLFGRPFHLSTLSEINYQDDQHHKHDGHFHLFSPMWGKLGNWEINRVSIDLSYKGTCPSTNEIVRFWHFFVGEFWLIVFNSMSYVMLKYLILSFVLFLVIWYTYKRNYEKRIFY